MTERPRMKQAAELEALARQWKDQLRAGPRSNAEERTHYREKAAEFRRLADAQLANLASACAQASDVAEAIAPEAGDTRAAALRDLGEILDGEAATARALASVQEVCIELDRVT